MHISSLVLNGFKSFGRKTTIELGEGITAVVGPNGCGKTNIVDALRWVLGEQKQSVLRSTRMEEIIFNGSKNLKPSSVCEATLTIHNDKSKLPVEYTDIEITRRLYRDGESEYLINRTPCRRKDILDLFMDTGMGSDAYSVIELKMIEAILIQCFNYALSGRGWAINFVADRTDGRVPDRYEIDAFAGVDWNKLNQLTVKDLRILAKKRAGEKKDKSK